MKIPKNLLLCLLLAIEALIVAGCAHTMNGASQDYHSAEDHVERAFK